MCDGFRPQKENKKETLMDTKENPEPISAQIEAFRKYFKDNSRANDVDIFLMEQISRWIEKALSTAHRNGVDEGYRLDARKKKKG